MEIFENNTVKIWIENDICYGTFLVPTVTVEIIDEAIIQRLNLQKGKDYVMISDIRNVKKANRAARERIGKQDSAEGTIAVGVIINSKIQAMMYNFFNTVYKAPRPAKLFTDVNEALKWLEQFKQKEND